MTDRPPASVRRAGVAVIIEGIAAVAVAVVMVVNGVGGADTRLALGTAGWFLLIGAGVAAAGVALWTGRRWGRGVAVLAQLLLLPIALAYSWRQPEYGVPVAVVALAVLVLLFSPSAQRWVSYAGDWDDSANSESAAPDNR